MNSKTFCIAPWVHACIRPSGNLSPCCEWQGADNYEYTEFDNWINSTDIQQAREQLYNGVKINACSKCWYNESIGKKSLRQIYNVEFSKNFDFSTIDDSWTIDSNTIKTFDLKLGNLCNLKCVMCSGNLSSQLMTEYKQNKEKFDRITMFKAPDVTASFDWPMSEDFQKFLHRFKDQIKWIKFTGGEPTLIPYVNDVLAAITDPSSVTVSLTTNATKVNQQLLNSLSKFKVVWLTVSLEGVGDANEQIRYLSSWKTIEKNIIELMQLPNTYFNISHIFQCFSIQTLIPLLQWCDSHNLKLNLTLLDRPKYLGINSIPADNIERFKKHLEQLSLVNNQEVIKQATGFLKNYKYDAALDQQRIEYLNLLDQLRSTQLSNIVEMNK